VLATMKDLEMLSEDEPGLYRLTRGGLTPDELTEMAVRYEKRSEHDRDKLRRMVHYAQTALCRWKAVLDYFGEEPEWQHCGHCDNCSHPIRELAPPPAEVPVRPQTGTEVLPLPPIVGVRDPGVLNAGDAVTLPIFGSGTVRSVDTRSLVITFTDGETREFRR
jgi:ATP-dependent DNA helicase RecQ